MLKEIKKMIEQYQCNGCVSGHNVDCFVSVRSGVGCGKHVVGTVCYLYVGSFLAGLPTGFNRVGKGLDICIFDSFEESQKPYGYALYNIPVWKHLDQYGNTLIRGLSPRTNRPLLDIIKGNVLDKINCLEITKDHINGMD